MSEEQELLRRRLEREIARRTAAESYAETRTRQLYAANEQLRAQLSAVTQLQERLSREAVTDPLTGAMNRRGLFRWLEEQLDLERSLALAYIDLVDFKSVNDRFDHAAGDQVLQVMSQRFSAAVGPENIVARVGGDEFIVAIHDVSDALIAQASVLAERIVRSGDEPVTLQESRSAKVGVRCGIALSAPGDTADLLVSRADQALGDGSRASARQGGQTS